MSKKKKTGDINEHLNNPLLVGNLFIKNGKFSFMHVIRLIKNQINIIQNKIQRTQISPKKYKNESTTQKQKKRPSTVSTNKVNRNHQKTQKPDQQSAESNENTKSTPIDKIAITITDVDIKPIITHEQSSQILNNASTHISTIISIDWSKIKFRNCLIDINHNNEIYSINDIRSKEIYNLIIPFFSTNRIKSPIFSIIDKNVTLTDIDQFFNLLDLGIEISPLQDIIHQILLQNNKATYISYHLLNEIAESIYKNHNEHIKYLSELQNATHKIIIVDENSNSLDESNRQPGFIFTLTTKTDVYYIWESTELSKATYIFSTNLISAQEKKENLIAYIKSSIPKKRKRLNNKNDFNYKYLGYCGKIIHTDFKQWESKMHKLLPKSVLKN